MIVNVREIERLDSRVLAAIRFVDAATGATVDAPLRLAAPGATQVLRNRSGLHVIRRHAPLAAHADSFFEQPAAPPPGDLTLTLNVNDPTGVYLPRNVQLALPRDARPDHADADDSLFRPVEVELYRSPAAPVGANWAALRVSLTETDTGDALGGALLRVVAGGFVLASGLSDWRGEALVPVVGIPITTWSDDENAVIVTDIDATLQVLFDDAHGGIRTPALQAANGRAPASLPVPDPQAIEANPAAVRIESPVTLKAGQPLAVALHLDLPA